MVPLPSKGCPYYFAARKCFAKLLAIANFAGVQQFARRSPELCSAESTLLKPQFCLDETAESTSTVLNLENLINPVDQRLRPRHAARGPLK